MIKLPAINTAPSPHKGTALMANPSRSINGIGPQPGQATSDPSLISKAHLGLLMAQKRRRSCHDS